MSDVVHGLYITALGMGLVFLTLGAILLLMTLLVRVFPPKREPAKTAPSAETPAAEDRMGEKIAAISAALALALAEESASMAAGRRIAADQGGWVAAGRTRQLNHPRAREKTS